MSEREKFKQENDHMGAFKARRERDEFPFTIIPEQTEEEELARYQSRVKEKMRAALDTAEVAKTNRERVELILPSERQIGGAHYAKFAIQPSEYIHRNQLGWCEGNAVKYISRHQDKGGRQDILKAIHYLELLLEWEYPQ